MLVVLDRAAGERPSRRTRRRSRSRTIAAGLRALADAGADEAILVVSPITEDSIRRLRGALAALDG